MENVMKNGFAELSADEMNEVDGGGFTAFVYALGFIAGTSPLAVCVGTGLVVVGGITYAVAKACH